MLQQNAPTVKKFLTAVSPTAKNLYCEKSSRSNVVVAERFHAWRKVLAAKCVHNKMSLTYGSMMKCPMAKNPYNEKSSRRNALLARCLHSEIYLQRSVLTVKGRTQTAPRGNVLQQKPWSRQGIYTVHSGMNPCFRPPCACE